VDANGNVLPDPVAEVDVSSAGLLGVAVDGEQRVFASWIRPEGNLVVGQVAPGEPRVVWVGPVSDGERTGGALAASPDGSIAIGVGDLGDRPAVTDRTAANGKVLAVDPNGDEEQRPPILSTGWVDPSDLAFLPDGELWVTDRGALFAARGGEGEPRFTVTFKGRVPSALAAEGPARLLICAGGELAHYIVEEDGTWRRGSVVANDCGPSVTVLSDLSIVYSTDDAIYEAQTD
jgi:hypothetical protein